MSLLRRQDFGLADATSASAKRKNAAFGPAVFYESLFVGGFNGLIDKTVITTQAATYAPPAELTIGVFR